MPSDSYQEYLRSNRIAIDDYLGSIRGLFAFVEAVRFDTSTRTPKLGSRIGYGRRMNQNVRGGTQVTPDVVVQLDNKYGIITEVKKHFAEGKTAHFDQIKKYDISLNGWWTEDALIPKHDITLLTYLTSVVDAADTLDLWENEGNKFDNNFIIIGYVYSDTVTPSLILKKERGELSYSEFDSELRKGIHFPILSLGSVIGNIKFYDAAPPLIHTMVVLYENILPLFGSLIEFEQSEGEVDVEVRCSINEITEKVAELCCPIRNDDRDPKLPKLDWVRLALTKLEEIGLAEKVTKKSDNYIIKLKPPKSEKDTIDYLSNKIFKKEKELEKVHKKTSLKQESLFKELDEKREIS